MRKKNPRKTTSSSPLAVKIDLQLKARLDRLSQKKDRSVHWLMKTAIESYVTQEEEAEKLKQETLERWQEAQQGKTVSNESVIAWLKTWGTDKEDEKPR